jgi:TRAP transporter TAXI family solute receptor
MTTTRISRRKASIAALAAIGLVSTVASHATATTTPDTTPADTGGDATAESVQCEAEEGRITIATGNSTGVYYVFGGGVADLISDETPIRATAAETGASVQNIEQLVAGDYDIAFSLADTASDAVAGLASFDEPQPVEALGRIHTNYTQVLVRNDAEIESVEDMAGHAISTGSPNSGTEVIAGRLLDAAGLAIDSDIDAQRLDLTATLDGMRDGSIDGFFWSGGLPTAAVTDLLSTDAGDVSFLDVTPLLPAMQEINPIYQEGVIPADAYGLDADVPTIIVPNVLLVREDFPAANACAITNLIWSNIDTLAEVHPAAAELDPSVALETGPIPLAPGAQQALEALGGSADAATATTGAVTDTAGDTTEGGTGTTEG